MAKISEELRQKIRDAKKADPSLSGRQLGQMFGVHKATANDIVQDLQVLFRPENGLSAGPYGFPVPASDEPQEPVFEENLSGKWTYGKGYTYNGDTDTYVMILKCRPQPLVISGTKFRAMKRAYSNWANKEATVNEICRRFEIPRDQFMELKTVHGWTHDQEPFTQEEVMSGDTTELVNDVYQQKRQALWEGFEQKKWQETKKAAENWNKLEQTFILPLREHIELWAPKYEVPLVNIHKARNPFAVVTNTGELHYGKAGWIGETGEEYNREVAKKRLLTAREYMLQEVADRGRPEKFYYTFGNDQVHIDTDNNTTTKGTGQDVDGTSAQLFTEAFDIFLNDADTLLHVAPVEVIYVPGNHDRLLSFAMLHSLRAWYRNEKRVTITVANDTRNYCVYGNSLMGFAHGDGALKPANFMATMAKEAAQWWSQTKHKAFFTGHLHSEVVRELIGGTHYQMRSLSGKDRYHARNAFLSEAGMNSYVVDKERGVTSTILWSPS